MVPASNPKQSQKAKGLPVGAGAELESRGNRAGSEPWILFHPSRKVNCSDSGCYSGKRHKYIHKHTSVGRQQIPHHHSLMDMSLLTIKLTVQLCC